MSEDKDAMNFFVLVGHIFNSAALAFIGFLFGVASFLMIQLFFSHWTMAIFAALLSLTMVVFLVAVDRFIDWLFEKIFPIGIRTATNQFPKSQSRCLDDCLCRQALGLAY